MRSCSTRVLFAVLILPFFLLSATASAQNASPTVLHKELAWSLPDNEVGSPRFSPDGTRVALVTRVHWPDGDEAEGLPESIFKKLQQRKELDPRFADPIVRVVDLKGNQVCEVRYGTNPSIAADNNSLVFARQRKPLTGMRLLAETQAGNDIQLFDCEKKEVRTLAVPSAGYFDNPIFLPDGHSVAYTVNEAVNGAMGGAVGIERTELNKEERDTLLARETKPAIPCATNGSTKLTEIQIMMCSQETKLSSSFPVLIEDVVMAGDKLLTLQAKPNPAPGDMYLASHYELSLATAFPQREDIFSMGQVAMDDWNVAFQSIGKDEVMIFAKYWKPFSLTAKGWLPESAPRNSNRNSIYSRNGEYYLAMEPNGEEPTQFALYRTVDGKRLFTSPKMTRVFDAAWSDNSRNFAVVTIPNRVSSTAYREVLTLYSLDAVAP